MSSEARDVRAGTAQDDRIGVAGRSKRSFSAPSSTAAAASVQPLPWRRWLILSHRWLGIGLSVLFALWFASGIFMMYVEFPQLTRPERLVGAPALDFSTARIAPGEAVARLAPSDFTTIGAPHANRPAAEIDGDVRAESVQLAMLLDRPVYHVYPANGAQPRVVAADTGEVLPRIDEPVARAAALDFAERSGLDAARLRYAGLVQTDQWSVSSALNAHRPLHLFALGDARGTELYVSSTTGEVVRDTHRSERLLNYPAAVTHWLYPTLIRRFADAWALMVEVLSGVGVVLGITGVWLGLMRLRRPRPRVSAIPYRGLMRWHHISGLAFGAVAITWALSGMLSLNPGGLNPSRSPSAAESEVFTGKPLTPEDFEVPDAAAGDRLVAAELMHYLGQPFFASTSRDGSTVLIPASDRAPVRPRVEDLIERAPALMPGIDVERVTLLDAYDNYWYTRDPGAGGRPLPVLRVEFADPERTWFHVDPETGQVVQRLNRTNRVYRWLYNGLHSWDVQWLREKRPLWDIVMIAFSLGGLALSITGIVTGFRYLRREAKRSRLKKTRAAA